MPKLFSIKALIYSRYTLGVYNLVWFARTRRELMAKTGIRIPSVLWLAALNVVQLAAIVYFAIAVFRPSAVNLKLVIASFVIAPISWWAYPHWLKNFLVAIEKATNGKMNQSAAAGLLMYNPSVGISIIEEALKNPETLPEMFGTFDAQQFARKLITLPAPIEENKFLKRTVVVITLLAIVFLAFLLAIPYLVNHLPS